MTPVLRTERLEFLPYRPEHEDVFVALLRDAEVCRWMGQDLVPEPQIRELFRAILSEIYPQRRFDVWGLWLAGDYVGHAEVKPTGNVDGHELVTALAPGYWGRGLGGEAVRGLLRHAADNLGLSEAYGMVGADNSASLAMCHRLGFRHVRDVVGDDGSVTKLLVISTRHTGGPPAAEDSPATTPGERPEGTSGPDDPGAPGTGTKTGAPTGTPGAAAAAVEVGDVGGGAQAGGRAGLPGGGVTAGAGSAAAAAGAPGAAAAAVVPGDVGEGSVPGGGGAVDSGGVAGAGGGLAAVRAEDSV
ncbi:GNAT family N-acetyltransferase [Streptomyces sp. Caat 7-52]|uniref:GNAT family N-acetyltransferase n=1 Tax=Streptomyces sp. Caat 7-52 TaxID=2949637 RepID=UPI0020357EDC|nr:GNAT family N-acetyltransferase [Streptomyces sp. Caat 7-52]